MLLICYLPCYVPLSPFRGPCLTKSLHSRKLLLEDVVAVEGVEDAAEPVVRRHHLEEAQARLGVPRPRAVDQHVLASSL